MVLVVTPIVASNSTTSGQQESILGKGYLLIHVFSFTPGSGFHPYQGANISVRGFLYSYNGTTDEYGDCLFTVFTKLFRAKIYFIKITIDLLDRVVTRRDIVYMSLREIEYKEYLFIKQE
jgi:hypothetical protein